MAPGEKSKRKSNEEILAKHKNELTSSEQEIWEKGSFYGEEPAAMSHDHASSWENAKSKVHPTSIRLPPSLLIELKKKASENGLGLHSYIRMILTRAVKQSA
jgi:predicted DNA binding CopG/RHH family protein